MGAWLVALVGALIVAAGLGVVIQTKWVSNLSGAGRSVRYRLSWPVVGVGLIVLVVGAVLALGHDHGGTTNINTNIVNVTGGNS